MRGQVQQLCLRRLKLAHAVHGEGNGEEMRPDLCRHARYYFLCQTYGVCCVVRRLFVDVFGVDIVMMWPA